MVQCSQSIKQVFHNLQRYGFIVRDDGQGDVFFHRTAVKLSDAMRIPKLEPDFAVQFTCVKADKGMEAKEVLGVGGQDIPVLEVSEIQRGRGRGRGRGGRGRGRGRGRGGFYHGGYGYYGGYRGGRGRGGRGRGRGRGGRGRGRGGRGGSTAPETETPQN